MWIVRVAWTAVHVIVLAVLILVLSPIMILRTPTDISQTSIPVIAGHGSSPAESRRIRSRLTSGMTELTTTVDNIEHIESTTVNGQAIVKIFLQHGASLDTAMPGDRHIQTALRQLPPGTLPPNHQL